MTMLNHVCVDVRTFPVCGDLETAGDLCPCRRKLHRDIDIFRCAIKSRDLFQCLHTTLVPEKHLIHTSIKLKAIRGKAAPLRFACLHETIKAPWWAGGPGRKLPSASFSVKVTFIHFTSSPTTLIAILLHFNPCPCPYPDIPLTHQQRPPLHK